MRETFNGTFAFDVGRGDLLSTSDGTGCAAQNALNHAVMKNGGDRGSISTFCAKSDSKKCSERCGGGEAMALVNFEGADFGDL